MIEISSNRERKEERKQYKRLCYKDLKQGSWKKKKMEKNWTLCMFIPIQTKLQANYWIVAQMSKSKIQDC